MTLREHALAAPAAAWLSAAEAGAISLQTVRLPMRGIAESLNVSATVAVLTYEAVRQELTR